MIRNLRDLGGIINCHGEVIPCRMFYRSANLSDATPDDLTGISEVIDLRTATGRERAPDQIPEHITYHAIPIVDEATAGITQDASLDSIPDMVSLYRKMVISCQSAIQSVLSIVFSHDYSSGGVLWHCTAGKDRSGLITAYVLAALGVTREEIMKDYMLSNAACIPEADTVRAQLIAAGKTAEEADKVWNVFIAKPEYLQSALDIMDFEENREFRQKVLGNDYYGEVGKE